MSLAVRSMRAMDVLLWLGVVCSLIALMFTVLIIGFGAKSARPPEWDERLREAAHAEVHRRGLDSPPLSRSDLIARTNLIGTNKVFMDPDDDRGFLIEVAALTDASEEQLESLKTQRARILEQALERQTSTVKDITDHQRASWVWKFCTWWNTVVMIISGIRWFLPLFFIKMHHIGNKYLSAATLLGVWIGLLWWGASHFNGRDSTTDWLGIVSAVITLSTVFALMAIIGRQLYAIRTALYDPASQLNLKYISAYVITIIILLLFLCLHSPEFCRDGKQPSTRKTWHGSITSRAPYGLRLSLLQSARLYSSTPYMVCSSGREHAYCESAIESLWCSSV